MKCPNCGSDVPAGAHFCDHCGAPINPDAVIPTAEPLPPASGFAGPNPEPYGPPSGPAYPPPPPPSFGSYNPPSATAFDATPEVVTPSLPSSPMGMVALILGILAVVLSWIACGGIIAIPGLIVGYLSLKTSGRQMGIIGMILSGIGLVIAIIFACIFGAAFMQSGNSSSY